MLPHPDHLPMAAFQFTETDAPAVLVRRQDTALLVNVLLAAEELIRYDKFALLYLMF